MWALFDISRCGFEFPRHTVRTMGYSLRGFVNCKNRLNGSCRFFPWVNTTLSLKVLSALNVSVDNPGRLWWMRSKKVLDKSGANSVLCRQKSKSGLPWRTKPGTSWCDSCNPVVLSEVRGFRPSWESPWWQKVRLCTYLYPEYPRTKGLNT